MDHAMKIWQKKICAYTHMNNMLLANSTTKIRRGRRGATYGRVIIVVQSKNYCGRKLRRLYN